MSLGNPSLTLVDSVDSADSFRRWLIEKADGSAPMIGADTETGGLDYWRCRLRTVQFGDTETGWVIPWQDWGGLARWAFETWDRGIVFHNAKFDLHQLEKEGINVGRHRIHDSLVLAHLTNNERWNGLKSLAATLIDPTANALENELNEAFRQQGWDWDTVPIDFPPYWQYAALDPVLTMQIWEKHAAEKAQFDRLYDIEMTVSQSLLNAETRGARVNREYCIEAQAGLRGEAEELAEQIKGYGVESPGSRQQLIQAFGQQGVQFTKFSDKGQISLDKEVLDGLAARGMPLAKLVQSYTHAVKIESTYLANFIDYADRDGFLHPSINQMAARTGRMSITRPAMQTLERSATVRDAIIPREGNRLLLIDYDQIELRLLASYAGMQHIIDAAVAGEDLHMANAHRIFPGKEITKAMRTLAKNTTFAKLYGAGAEKIANMTGMSLAEAVAFIGDYDLANPELMKFIASVEQADRERKAADGFAYVSTAYGRRLRRNEWKGAYVLVNYLIQGTAADVLKEKIALLAMAGLDEFFVLPVHDELVFDVPVDIVEDYAHEVKAVMEEHDKFAAPLTVGVDIVDSWGDPYRNLEAA